MRNYVRRHVKQIPHNAKLEARVHRKAGMARTGQWTWYVRIASSKRTVARAQRPYLRKAGAERGVLRAYPKATLVEA